MNSLSSVRLSRPLFASDEAKAPLLCEAFCYCSLSGAAELACGSIVLFSFACFGGKVNFSFGKKNGVALSLNLLPVCAVFCYIGTGMIGC